MDGNKKPYFSVVIPLYNKAASIRKSLDSVFAQSFKDFEVIVVNDGSTDGGELLLNEIKDSRIQIFDQENQGASAARNKGIGLANAEFICFLDADDEWKPEFLEEIHSLTQKFPQHKVFASAVEIEAFGKVFPAQYQLNNEVANGIFIENYFAASFLFSILWTSATVIHKAVFHKVGNFDITIKSGQDTDLWIRIGEFFPIVFTTKILARYTEHHDSLSRKKNLKSEPKIRYEKFPDLEKRNPDAKKFLDLNRYSEVLTLKMNGNLMLAKRLQKEILIKNLPLKKQILLQMPDSLLKILLKIQPLLIKCGIRKSYFK